MTDDIVPLSGLTVLVIEDEPFLAVDLSLSLEDAGATVLGPCPTVYSALQKLKALDQETVIHAAVLDFSLDDETSEPIAEWLIRIRTPFLFYIGGEKAAARIEDRFDVPIIRKPCKEGVLIECLVRLLRKG